MLVILDGACILCGIEILDDPEAEAAAHLEVNVQGRVSDPSCARFTIEGYVHAECAASIVQRLVHGSVIESVPAGSGS